jgi:hypothetical protein
MRNGFQPQVEAGVLADYDRFVNFSMTARGQLA